ncbi:MAG: indole-3-glycerol phosphate synthase TrpC, partial [Pseudomonadota bacterium]
AARAASNLPVLRKDFMIDPWQILESRLLGADCVLLIMAALARNQAIELEQTALEAGMDVLIEVHDAKELDAAQSWLQSAMIGINSRDLRTLKVSLAATESLLPKIGSKHLAIAESGIEHPDDIERLAAAGARAFLVGSSLMKARDLAQATRTLAGGHL